MTYPDGRKHKVVQAGESKFRIIPADQGIPPCSDSGCGTMVSRSWWARNIIIGLLSMFFLVFGINSLITAYVLTNPLEFIISFFSSSLIILICIVGIIYPFFRIRAVLKTNKMDEK